MRWIKKPLAQLLFWIYQFLDDMQAIFNVLTGTQQVAGSEGGTKKSLLEIFMETAVSTKVILGLVTVGVVIAGVCVGVRVVKNTIALKAGGETHPHSVTIGQGVLGVFSSVVCIFFVFLFIAFSNMLLNMVNNVIKPENGATLSQNLFDISVEETYAIDESKWEIREELKYDAAGYPIPKLDENGDPIPDEYETVTEKYHPIDYDHTKSGYHDGYEAKDINFKSGVDTVFGRNHKILGLFELNGDPSDAQVDLDSFNLLTAYLSAIIMLISMFMLCLSLVKRLYDIIILFICMPLVCGTIPLDDGARFKAWRETLMSKILIVFGAVIALNVFFMVSGAINNLPWSQWATDGTFGKTSSTVLRIFRMVLICGGALCINGSMQLIARVLGTSADEGREAMQSLATVAGGARLGAAGFLGAARVAGSAGRGVFGGRNRYGREVTGAIPSVFRGINKAEEAADKMRMKHGQDASYTGSRGAAFVRKMGRLPKSDAGGVSGNGRGGLKEAPAVQPLAQSSGSSAPKESGSSVHPSSGVSRNAQGGAFKNTRKK